MDTSVPTFSLRKTKNNENSQQGQTIHKMFEKNEEVNILFAAQVNGSLHRNAEIPLQFDAEKDCSISVGILSHDATVLEKSMETWEKAGLFDLASEVLVFLNMRSTAMEVVVDRFRRPERTILLFGNAKNVVASTAFIELVRSARFRFFLFLERDFRAVEPLGRVLHEIGSGMDIMNAGTGVSMYLRSRNCPGHPNFAQESLGGKEHIACARDERYFSHLCYAWHWQNNSNLLRSCPSTFRTCQQLNKSSSWNESFLCIPTGACAFSQNPSLFLRDPWFASLIKSWDSFDWKNSHTGPDTPYSQIENYMSFAANLPGAPKNTIRLTGNSNPWAALNQTVILGEGIFRHDDFIKHGNTENVPCILAGVPKDILDVAEGRKLPPDPPQASSSSRCKDFLLLRFLKQLALIHSPTTHFGEQKPSEKSFAISNPLGSSQDQVFSQGTAINVRKRNVPDVDGNCCVSNSYGKRACVRAGTRLAFRDNTLCERGTSIAIFDYMDAFERLLCGVAWVSSQDSDTLCPLYNGVSSAHRFRARFGNRSFVTDRWWSSVDADLKRENIGTLYQLMAGDVAATGTLPKCARNVVHAVFDATNPHGDGFAAISPVISMRPESPAPIVLHIVPPPLDINGANMRAELGIADSDVVFCRHGGGDTFNIAMVRNALCSFMKDTKTRPWFLFLGTDPLICAPGVLEAFGQTHFLKATSDILYKSRFLNTCDACMHARVGGESFGLAVAECSKAGLPVITYNGKDVGDNYHLVALGLFALGYSTSDEFIGRLQYFDKSSHKSHAHEYRQLYSNSSEENVMVEFVRAFVPDAPPKC